MEIEAETEGDNERSEESKKKNMNMWCPISYKNTLFFFSLLFGISLDTLII